MRQLALFYVGKYATTQAKLSGYLARKTRERGWDDERPADIAALTEQFAALGYINDAQFAEARSRSFVRRGFGERRLNEDLRASGMATSRHHHQRVALVVLEIAVDRGDRGLLIGAQGQHGAASVVRASFAQVEPSAMR